MTHFKAVIFDMDGVIINSEMFWKQAEYEVFTSLGVNVTAVESALTKSMTTSEVTNFWYHISPWEGKDHKDVEQMVISRVIELIETEDCQIEGVKDFIELLKEKHYKIGLATNSPQRIIPTVLKKLGIEGLFDAVLSAEFEIKGKPDPTIYFNAAKKLNTDPADCIVIEDSHSGMLAAKNAGMTVIAFTNENPEAEFDIADFKINSFCLGQTEIKRMGLLQN
ncbi:hexitol phosphatase HxpB [Belliella marina]|uniref:Hexitol phosphatase HxpB n=1 Tax=Belliella marina TaxID=1644146 RepID=A0ABW4VW57_9BACT